MEIKRHYHRLGRRLFGKSARLPDNSLTLVPIPDAEEVRAVIQFLVELGAAMSSAGDATTFIRRALECVARAYGLPDLKASVGQTLLLLRFAGPSGTVVELTTIKPVSLRLSQVADVYRLFNEVVESPPAPEAARQRLREILEGQSSFGWLGTLAGLVLLAGGVSWVLEPSLSGLAACCLLGLVVGVIMQAAD